MKANIYHGIVTLVDVYTDFGKLMIPKGTQGTIVECYENSEGYAIDLAIPDDRWIGGFDYENVILTSDQFELTISPVALTKKFPENYDSNLYTPTSFPWCDYPTR